MSPTTSGTPSRSWRRRMAGSPYSAGRLAKKWCMRTASKRCSSDSQTQAGSHTLGGMKKAYVLLFSILAVLAALPLFSDDGSKLLSVDHYVRVNSTVPAISGQTTQIYMREVVRAGTALREGALGDRVVLFVHGAGTPAEVAFDVPYQDYSWMGFLARAGFDVFSMDMTVYVRSPRPAAMNDPCNLSHEQQLTFVSTGAAAVISATYGQQMTTLASDWNDIGTGVDHLLALRDVD